MQLTLFYRGGEACEWALYCLEDGGQGYSTIGLVDGNYSTIKPTGAGELFHHDAFDEEAHVRRGVVGVDCYRLAVVAGAAAGGIVFYLYATLFAGLYGFFGVLGGGAAAARGDL